MLEWRDAALSALWLSAALLWLGALWRGHAPLALALHAALGALLAAFAGAYAWAAYCHVTKRAYVSPYGARVPRPIVARREAEAWRDAAARIGDAALAAANADDEWLALECVAMLLVALAGERVLGALGLALAALVGAFGAPLALRLRHRSPAPAPRAVPRSPSHSKND